MERRQQAPTGTLEPVAVPDGGFPTVLVYRNLMVPMRDGTRLATDIYLPSMDGLAPAPGRFPLILSRTPYNKTARSAESAPRMARHGYAVAIQDKRGRYASEGVYRLLRDDSWGPNQDGYDTVEWLARQPWCNGRVGMWGVSYLGFTTMAAALTRPPHLVAGLTAQPSSDQFTDRTYIDGVFSLGSGGWNSRSASEDVIARLPAGERAGATRELEEFNRLGDAAYTVLPITAIPFQRLIPHLWRDFLLHRDDPEFMAEDAIGSARLKDLTVPMYHVGAWFDPFLRNNLRQYKAASSLPEDPTVRGSQRLLVGPWLHGGFAEARAGEMEFPDAALDLTGLTLAWHDRWLRQVERVSLPDFPVIIYVMGANRWRAEEAWPLPGTKVTAYYLRSGGLLATAPPGDEPADIYAYDPADPYTGAPVTAGMTDQSALLGRRDLLVYSTPPLDRPVEVTGEISAVLYAASSATDTDWVLELHDVFPDGRSFTLAEGVCRARYRHSRTRPEPLTPGSVERYELDLRATSMVFQPGHRIRVVLTSSKFPRYERNPNAFVDLTTCTERDFVVAQQSVHHSRAYPSCVRLPVVDSARHQRWIANPMPPVAEPGAPVALVERPVAALPVEPVHP